MSGKTLSPTERLGACFLFFFQSGRQAESTLSEGVGRVSVRTPTEDDLHAILNETGIGAWRGIEPFAEQMVRLISQEADRDVMDIARDVVGAVQRGQKALEKFAGGPAVDISHFAQKRRDK